MGKPSKKLSGMDLIREELKSAGVYPTGPVSAWPKERNAQLNAIASQSPEYPSMGKMAKGLAKTAKQAIMNGRVSKEIRKERYEICRNCPAFDSESKRCKECGCFMEAKTWIGGSPKVLCPLQKWSR